MAEDDVVETESTDSIETVGQVLFTDFLELAVSIQKAAEALPSLDDVLEVSRRRGLGLNVEAMLLDGEWDVIKRPLPELSPELEKRVEEIQHSFSGLMGVPAAYFASYLPEPPQPVDLPMPAWMQMSALDAAEAIEKLGLVLAQAEARRRRWWQMGLLVVMVVLVLLIGGG